MSQNDFVIANQSFPATRADINSALQAAASNSSGSSAPATTYANQFWYDTATNLLKLRSEANDAWITIGYLDQTANAFRVIDDTQVTSTAGVQTGILGDQPTATWEAGTGTVETLTSPAKIKAAILALDPANASPVGDGQTWAAATRARNTVYQNVAGKAVQVVASLVALQSTDGGGAVTVGSTSFQVSSDGIAWVTLATITATGGNYDMRVAVSAVIPDDYYYKWVGTATNASATISLLS